MAFRSVTLLALIMGSLKNICFKLLFYQNNLITRTCEVRKIIPIEVYFKYITSLGSDLHLEANQRSVLYFNSK